MRQMKPDRLILAVLSIGCMISSSVLLAAGHAVATFQTSNRSVQWAMEKYRTEYYFDTFGWVLYAGLLLMALSVALAVLSLLPVRQPPAA